MTSSYVFDVDDLAVGSSEVMVSIERRRFLLSNLSEDHIQALVHACRLGTLQLDSIPPRLSSTLIEIGALHFNSSSSKLTRRIVKSRIHAVIPSRFVKPICSSLTPLVTTRGLFLLLAFSLTSLIFWFRQSHYSIGIIAWLSTASPTDFLIVSAIFLSCIAFHELGHGAACLLRSGLVGAISARFYMGIPAFTTDVSSVQRVSHRDKAAIAISGIVFQVALSATLLLCLSKNVQIAATFSLMSAAFAAAPLPGSDGYWFLTDYFRTKVIGSFGVNGRKDWIGWLYTSFLVGITLYFSITLIHEGCSMLRRGLAKLASHEASASFFLIFTAMYMLIVIILFIKRTIRFLITGDARIM